MWLWLCVLGVAALINAMPAAEAAGKVRNAASADTAGVQASSAAAVRGLARTKPPRAYAGQNPSQAARAQRQR